MDEEKKPPAWHFIRQQPASQRSTINIFQAKLLAASIYQLIEESVRHFSIADLGRLPPERFERIRELGQYQTFIDSAYACGFVCRDMHPKANLEIINLAPAAYINNWPFPKLRNYIHTLIRAEKWADGYSSPIYEALQSGSLYLVAERLTHDDSLYGDG